LSGFSERFLHEILTCTHLDVLHATRGLGKEKGMQEYVTGEAESWSLFDQLIKPIPSLGYPFIFSLRESDHLPP
jgi:hypothetical protein